MPKVEYLTAETERGRAAIAEVMEQAAYDADLDLVPARWALARVVDDQPVSFITVDPAREMAFPGGGLSFAFICDVATRPDRRGEGHFRGIMQETFSRLRRAGVPLVVTHGRHQLYRQFQFDVFTHHSGIFVTPEQIEYRLGSVAAPGSDQCLVVEERKAIHDDLLLVTDVRADSPPACSIALKAAAALARRRSKTRILFEHPAAPSYGSRYPPYRSLTTPLTSLAWACGAEIRVQGAHPESGTIPDADWIKILDLSTLVANVLEVSEIDTRTQGVAVRFETEGQCAAIGTPDTEPTIIEWPLSAVAQLMTGYQAASTLDAIHETALPGESIKKLERLFPQRWRLSRNESWTFKQ